MRSKGWLRRPPVQSLVVLLAVETFNQAALPSAQRNGIRFALGDLYANEDAHRIAMFNCVDATSRSAAPRSQLMQLQRVGAA